MRQLQYAAEHFEHEHAKSEIDGEIVVEFQTGRSQKAQVAGCRWQVRR
jgi:hypothetical protein